MRKQNRIISLVIVLALLLSMLAAFAQVGAEGEAETFVPTATAEAMTSTVKDPVLAGTASNLATGVDATNWNDAVLGKYLWTEASGNKYLSLTTLADKSAGNHFFVVSTEVPTDPANKISFVKEGEEVTASGYYIVDFDFASETGYPNRFFISPNIGYPGHSSYTQRLDPDFSQKPLADMAGTADGNWHHFTLVGDLANNKSYAYIDGKFVADMGVAFAESADPNAAPDYTQEYYLSTVRVEVRGNQAIGVGNTLNLDNFGARTFAEDASLAAALEAKDLTAWDKNVANPTGSLPTVAKVDGTEVTMMSGLRAALATSDTSVNVEILRDFHDKITVNRPAVVDTHGLATGLVAGDGVKAVADGNVVTYSIPYRPNMTVEGTGNKDVIHKAISIKRDDNIMTAFGTSNVKDTHTAGYSSGAIITNKLNGDKYFRWYDDGCTSKSNVYAQMYSNNEIAYASGVSQYMVYDFDFAYLCGGALFNLASVCRAVTSGTGGWGTNSNNYFGSVASTWTPGTFHHVTVVMDFQTNQMIIYVDNVVFQTINNGIMGADGFKKWTAAEGNKVKMEALRLGQNQNQTAAIDNTCVRYITDDESLANAIAAQNLFGWTDAILNESYVMPQCATVASVDGENVYSAEQLADKIALRGNHTAEIFCTLPEKVAVDGDAVVETHEFEVNFVLGDGVTSATEGSVITFDAPFKPSATSTAPIPGGSSSDMLAAAAVSGIATIRHANLYTPRVNITVVTDATTGNKYIDFRSVSGPAATAHSFVEIETAPHAYTEDTFTVIDFDVAFEYDLIGEMYVQFNSRTPSGANRTAKSNVSEWGLERGKWAHVTIVCDINNNVMNYYVNNKLATSVAGSIYTGEIVDGKAVENGAQIYFYGMRINLNESNKLSTNQNVAFDNISISHGVESEWLLNNPGAESIEAWEGRTMNGEYKLPVFPVVANVDGVDYNSIPDAEAALADDGKHDVSIERDFPGAITVDSSATIVTNGINGKVAPAAPKVVELTDESLLLQATIVTDNGDGTLTYLQTNESNYTDYTAGIMWANDDFSIFEQIYYTFGTTVEYVGTKLDDTSAYLQNGNLIVPDWTWYDFSDVKQESLIGKVVVDKSYDNEFYAMLGTKDAGAVSIKYNLSLYSNFVINLYVPVSISTNTSAVKVEIDGVEYYVFEKAVDATEIANIATFQDIALTVDGQDVTVDVPVSILTYAEKIFANENYSEQLKQVIYAALEYANEAAKALVTEGDVESIVTILEKNAAYATDDAVVGDSADYSALTGIVESARLRLDAQPDFVIKMSTEYVGTVTVSYVNFAGETVTATFESKGEGEEFVIEGMKVYEIANTLTITAGEAVGEYSLETYINGITEDGINSAFATALLNYAKLALAYKNLVKSVA